jgi:hypothetical protein
MSELITCMGCGRDLETVHPRIQRHCNAPECVDLWMRWVIQENAHPEDGHIIWDGPVKEKRQMPRLRVAEWHPRGQKHLEERAVTFRVVDILHRMRDGSDYSGWKYQKLCDLQRCVTPDHHIPLKMLNQSVHDRRTYYISAKLPAQPLLDIIDSREWGIGRKENSALFNALKMARKTGRISVTHVDTICCDILHRNPVEIYGELFLTVGTDEEPAA